MRPLELHRQIELEELLNEIAKYQQGGGLSVFGQNQVNLPSQQAGIQSGVIGLNPLSTQQLTGIQENNLSRDFRERQFDELKFQSDRDYSTKMFDKITANFGGLGGSSAAGPKGLGTGQGGGFGLLNEFGLSELDETERKLSQDLRASQNQFKSDFISAASNPRNLDFKSIGDLHANYQKDLNNPLVKKRATLNRAVLQVEEEVKKQRAEGKLLNTKALSKIYEKADVLRNSKGEISQADLTELMSLENAYYDVENIEKKINDSAELFAAGTMKDMVDFAKNIDGTDNYALLEKISRVDTTDFFGKAEIVAEALLRQDDVRAYAESRNMTGDDFLNKVVIPSLKAETISRSPNAKLTNKGAVVNETTATSINKDLKDNIDIDENGNLIIRSRADITNDKFKAEVDQKIRLEQEKARLKAQAESAKQAKSTTSSKSGSGSDSFGKTDGELRAKSVYEELIAKNVVADPSEARIIAENNLTGSEIADIVDRANELDTQAEDGAELTNQQIMDKLIEEFPKVFSIEDEEGNNLLIPIVENVFEKTRNAAQAAEAAAKVKATPTTFSTEGIDYETIGGFESTKPTDTRTEYKVDGEGKFILDKDGNKMFRGRSYGIKQLYGKTFDDFYKFATGQEPPKGFSALEDSNESNIVGWIESAVNELGLEGYKKLEEEYLYNTKYRPKISRAEQIFGTTFGNEVKTYIADSANQHDKVIPEIVEKANKALEAQGLEKNDINILDALSNARSEYVLSGAQGTLTEDEALNIQSGRLDVLYEKMRNSLGDGNTESKNVVEDYYGSDTDSQSPEADASPTSTAINDINGDIPSTKENDLKTREQAIVNEIKNIKQSKDITDKFGRQVGVPKEVKEARLKAELREVKRSQGIENLLKKQRDSINRQIKLAIKDYFIPGEEVSLNENITVIKSNETPTTFLVQNDPGVESGNPINEVELSEEAFIGQFKNTLQVIGSEIENNRK